MHRVKNADDFRSLLRGDPLELPPPSLGRDLRGRVADLNLVGRLVLAEPAPLPPVAFLRTSDALDTAVANLATAGVMRLPPAVDTAVANLATAGVMRLPPAAPPGAPIKGFTDLYNYDTGEWEKIPAGKRPAGVVEEDEPSFEPRKKMFFAERPSTPEGQ